MKEEGIRDLAAKLNFLQGQLVQSRSARLALDVPRGQEREFSLMFPVCVGGAQAASTCVFLAGHQLWNFKYPVNVAHAFEQEGFNFCYVRDFYCAWYSRGLLGLTRSLRESAPWLQGYLQAKGLRPDACSGFSSGAFAAIVLGTLMGSRKVLAFAPQTLITPEVVSHFSAQNPYTPASFFNPLPESFPLDLAEFLAGVDNPPEIHVVYGAGCAKDVEAAQRLRDLPRVVLHAVPGCSEHQVLQHVLRSGGLKGLVTEVLQAA